MSRRRIVLGVTILAAGLGAAPSAGARYIVNNVNPACHEVLDRWSPRFREFEPAARVEAYLDCTARKIGEVRDQARQLLEQTEAELRRRRDDLQRPCDAAAAAFPDYRGKAMVEFARAEQGLQDVLTLSRMVRSSREQNVEAQRDARWGGTLVTLRVDPLPRVRAFNQQEAATADPAVQGLIQRARDALRWLASAQPPPCVCRWVPERQLGLMHSNRHACMCGTHFETQNMGRCGPLPAR